MKLKTIALTVLAVIASSGIQAQSKTSPAEGTKGSLSVTQDDASRQQLEADRIAKTNASSEQLAKDLGLDEKQAARLKELDEKYARMLNEVRASTTDRAVIMEKDNSMRAEHDKELQQILTPEQYKKMMSSR